MIAQTLGWIATILFTACYIPQIIKTLKTKDISGVSITLFVVQLIANVVALVYALLIKQVPLEVKYTLGIVFLIIVLGSFYGIHRRTTKLS